MILLNEYYQQRQEEAEQDSFVVIGCIFLAVMLVVGAALLQ